MNPKLLNPFTRIAGTKSLVYGLLIILSTSLIGHYSHTHFPDILSVKLSPDFPVWYFILQGLSNWLVISSLLYLAAKLFSKSSVRLIDIFGTQALARTPYLLAALMGFSNTVEKLGKHLLWTLLQQGEPITISQFEIALAILLMGVTLLLTVWLITLMFNAFKVSSNLKGPKLVLSFIVILISSMPISAYLTQLIITKFT
jgi:hypothetical protein